MPSLQQPHRPHCATATQHFLLPHLRRTIICDTFQFMSLSKKIQQALNDQINAEFHSAYIYLAMSSYCQANNLIGSAHWMRVQSQEELLHATKLYTFVQEREGTVTLKDIKAPATPWKSTIGVFEDALKHERSMTVRINELVDLAIKEKDHATNNLMQWFVTEQVEEEGQLTELLQKLKLIGGEGTGLFMIDQELAARPSPVTINAALLNKKP